MELRLLGWSPVSGLNLSSDEILVVFEHLSSSYSGVRRSSHHS